MHDDPIAYFITWTCYGTWMPGDDRGWVRWHGGDQIAQPLLAAWCERRMAEIPVELDTAEREIVQTIVKAHCRFRGWPLHAVNCRSNHCHVVVTAAEYHGEQVRDQLKSWSTRRLSEREKNSAHPREAPRTKWWSRKGSVRYLFDNEALENATMYTLEAQDIGGSKASQS